MKINEIVPVGYVKNSIFETGLPGNEELESEIILSERIPGDAYEGIGVFSHIELLYYLDTNNKAPAAGYSGSKPGIKGTRIHEPKLFGNAIVRLLKSEDRILLVKGFDAVNGTSVIDIKPVMNEISSTDRVITGKWEKNTTERN